MNVAVDANVVLDVILNRAPWAVDSRAVWDAVAAGRVQGFVVATAVTNMFYVARRIIGQNSARTAVTQVLHTFQVLPVDGQSLRDADTLPGTDLEDNLVAACATLCGMDLIVTRDIQGFAGCSTDVCTPADALARFPAPA